MYTGAATGCEVRNLDPATTYALRVRAHTAIGSSAWGDVLTVTTAAAAPSAPTALVVAAAGPNELRVCWAPPQRQHGAPVTGYLVEMAGSSGRAAGSGGGGSAGGAGAASKGSSSSTSSSRASKAMSSGAWSKVWQGACTDCLVPGLAPGRRYQFRVRASNTQGSGPWCEVAEGTTRAAPPGAPGRPAVTQRAAASLKVRWPLPAEDNGALVTSYRLQARPRGGGSDTGTGSSGSSSKSNSNSSSSSSSTSFVDAYSGVDHTARVSGLQPGTKYELRVAAVNSEGQGPWSEVETASTTLQPPPPPSGLEADVMPGPCATLHIRWRAAEEPGPTTAAAVGYEVEALPSGGSGSSSGAGASTKAAAASAVPALRHHVGLVEAAALSGAAPGCRYSVRIRSVGAAGSGHSNWSDAVVIFVPPAPKAASADCDSDSNTPAASGAAGLAPGADCTLSCRTAQACACCLHHLRVISHCCAPNWCLCNHPSAPQASAKLGRRCAMQAKTSRWH